VVAGQTQSATQLVGMGPDLLPALRGGGSPQGGSQAPSPGLQRPLGPGSWSYPGQHRGSSGPSWGLGFRTPGFLNIHPRPKGRGFRLFVIIRQDPHLDVSARPSQPPAYVFHKTAVARRAFWDCASTAADSAGDAANGRRQGESKLGSAGSVRLCRYFKSLSWPLPEAVHVDPYCV
jgi:hypothetical protein